MCARVRVHAASSGASTKKPVLRSDFEKPEVKLVARLRRSDFSPFTLLIIFATPVARFAVSVSSDAAAVGDQDLSSSMRPPEHQ